MSGIATAIVTSTAVNAYGTYKAGKSAEEGAEMSADAQMAQLEYLKEVDKLPREYREEALRQMSERVLEPGGRPGQAQMIEEAKASPLYSAIMGGQEAGEEAILRQAGATGVLRSGNVQEALAGFSSDLQNQALLQAYQEQVVTGQRELSELQGIAGLPSGTQQIGQTMANIGATRGAGEIAQGQIYQQGLQGLSNTALTGLSLGIQAGKI